MGLLVLMLWLRISFVLFNSVVCLGFLGVLLIVLGGFDLGSLYLWLMWRCGLLFDLWY